MSHLRHAMQALGRHGMKLNAHKTHQYGENKVTHAEVTLPSTTFDGAKPNAKHSIVFVEPQAEIAPGGKTQGSNTQSAEALVRIAHDVSPSAIVVVDRLHPRTASTLFSLGVQYIDSAGNMFVQFPGVYVHVAGQKYGPGVTRQSLDTVPSGTLNSGAMAPSSAGKSLFSGRHLQAILPLLEGQKVESIRALSALSKVSVGTAAGTMTGLRRLGFVEGFSLVSEFQGLVLDLWAEAYAQSKLFSQVLGTYYQDPDLFGSSDFTGLDLSGEVAASDIVRPTSMVLFADSWSVLMGARNHWNTQERPNIVVKRRFWLAPDSQLREDHAPLAVTYAELLQSSSPRVVEAAEEFRHVHIGF